MVLHLLEINVISAQDLARMSRSMHTYAVVWVNPERKLTTRIDNNGQTNPAWNDKFVFRVDDRFLEAETSAIMIEIYSQAWFKDICVGTVCVLVNNILPYCSRTTTPHSSNKRFISLQVRRPSGRPQGILNMGVALLDNTMRSMPLSSEVSFNNNNNSSGMHLRRCFSDKSRTTNDFTPSKNVHVPFFNGGSMVNGSIYNGSVVNGSELGGPIKGGASMISDIGPSASVVGLAIARGLYPYPTAGRHNVNNNNINNRKLNPTIAHDDEGSCILNDWTEKASSEGAKTKIERWRTELPPVYDTKYRRMTPSHRGQKPRSTKQRSNGGGLFSCFGNAYGCEFSITCGGATTKKRFGSSKVQLSPNPDMDNYSQSYV